MTDLFDHNDDCSRCSERGIVLAVIRLGNVVCTSRMRGHCRPHEEECFESAEDRLIG